MRIRLGAIILLLVVAGEAVCQNPPSPASGMGQDRYKYTPTVWGYLPASTGVKVQDYRVGIEVPSHTSKTHPTLVPSNSAAHAPRISSYFRPARPVPTRLDPVETLPSPQAKSPINAVPGEESPKSTTSFMPKSETVPQVRISRSCASLASGSHADQRVPVSPANVTYAPKSPRKDETKGNQAALPTTDRCP